MNIFESDDLERISDGLTKMEEAGYHAFEEADGMNVYEIGAYYPIAEQLAAIGAGLVEVQ